MNPFATLFESGRHAVLVVVAVTGLALGTALWVSGSEEMAGWAWAMATAPVLVALFAQIATALMRGDVGLDLVAALSMSAALIFGEHLAANVVALMYAGGQLLEAYAEGRARHEMQALLGRVARTAMRYDDGSLIEIDITSLAQGDRLLIRQGEVLPVDGRVSARPAVLDTSALTGEAVPQHIAIGTEALSGTTSVGEAFDLIVSRPAAESTYANIVRLVAAAQASKAPIMRLADRYAVWFLLLTLTIAGAAWFVSGDPIRALSVLVVATPCPLILAVPVAMISGVSRAARHGALVKGAAVLERLAAIRIGVLDKTGTLTHGEAEVVDVIVMGRWTREDILALAASLDQASSHVVAAALVKSALAQGLALELPHDVSEAAGRGVTGTVGDARVSVGARSYLAEQGVAASRSATAPEDGEALTVWVGINGAVAGVIVLKDRVRADAAHLVADLKASGLSRVVLASGDRNAIAYAVGTALGFDAVIGEMTPQDKLLLVRKEAEAGPVLMVGDGVNDAPALAAADVGVAMGARGAAASSEAAGVVLLLDQLAPLGKAITIARETRAIALQSVWWGLGLSILAMLIAAMGYLPPVQGALLQEAIDVAVILNALRALRDRGAQAGRRRREPI